MGVGGQSNCYCLFLSNIWPPLICDTKYLIKYISREYDISRKDCSSLRMEFEYKFRNNAKVRSSSSDTPEKIGIFSLTRGQNRAIGGDDCNLVEISGRYGMI